MFLNSSTRLLFPSMISVIGVLERLPIGKRKLHYPFVLNAPDKITLTHTRLKSWRGAFLYSIGTAKLSFFKSITLHIKYSGDVAMRGHTVAFGAFFLTIVPDMLCCDQVSILKRTIRQSAL